MRLIQENSQFTVRGPLNWYDNTQVRMWIILDINNNVFHHLGRSQMCAGAWYVFRTSKPHSGTLCPGKTCSIRPDRVGMDPTRQDAELQVSRRDVATIVSEAGFPPQAASSHGWTSCGYSPWSCWWICHSVSRLRADTGRGGAACYTWLMRQLSTPH